MERLGLRRDRASPGIAALARFAEWEEWLNVALGVWLIASPWILAFAAHPRLGGAR